MPGPYRLSLVKQETTLNSGSSGYRLQVTVQSPLNMSEKVFVYLRSVLGTDMFEGICTPAQLSLLPVDAPDPQLVADPKRFRKATFDKTYTLVTDLADGWKAIYTGIDVLLNRLDIIDKLVSSQTFTIGTTTITHTTDVFLQA